jgi:hypothetical protein
LVSEGGFERAFWGWGGVGDRLMPWYETVAKQEGKVVGCGGGSGGRCAFCFDFSP